MTHPRPGQKWLTTAAVCLWLLMAVPGAFAATLPYKHRYTQDINTILSSRHTMKAAVDFVDAHPEIFPTTEVEENAHPLTGKQRMTARQSWLNVVDHILFFDTMAQMYGGVYDTTEGKEEKTDPFMATFACFLAQYRFAMEYINRMENNPSMHVILNETVPEFGLEKGTYARMKYRFLNVLRGAEFARLNVVYHYYGKARKNSLDAAIKEDMAAIWQAGRGMGPSLTIQNGKKIVADFGFSAWFPVQKGISELLGEIKVWRPGISLISPKQINQLKDKLRPGDILLQRREWYATNVGIPGFWTHAALYIGSPEERTRYFTGKHLSQWFKEQSAQTGTLDSLLKNNYPKKYQASILPQEQGHQPRVLEAIGEGVTFTTLEHSAAADSMVVLRPNLPMKRIAQAIIKAFHYSGRPYDFNFDFRTDSELVCSELIYKVYETTQDDPGLSLPLTTVLDRPMLSPNEIARIFSEEFRSDSPQFTFVAFLDGNEQTLKADESNVKAFLSSWQRPKYHVWVQ